MLSTLPAGRRHRIRSPGRLASNISKIYYEFYLVKSLVSVFGVLFMTVFGRTEYCLFLSGVLLAFTDKLRDWLNVVRVGSVQGRGSGPGRIHICPLR